MFDPQKRQFSHGSMWLPCPLHVGVRELFSGFFCCVRKGGEEGGGRCSFFLLRFTSGDLLGVSGDGASCVMCESVCQNLFFCIRLVGVWMASFRPQEKKSARVPLYADWLSEQQFYSFLLRYPGINYTCMPEALRGAVM